MRETPPPHLPDPTWIFSSTAVSIWNLARQYVLAAVRESNSCWLPRTQDGWLVLTHWRDRMNVVVCRRSCCVVTSCSEADCNISSFAQALEWIFTFVPAFVFVILCYFFHKEGPQNCISFRPHEIWTHPLKPCFQVPHMREALFGFRTKPCAWLLRDHVRAITDPCHAPLLHVPRRAGSGKSLIVISAM